MTRRAEPNMKRKLLCLACLLVILPLASGCRSRTDKSAGPVVLTFGQIGPVPITVSVTAADQNGESVQIPSFTIDSFLKDPTAVGTSPLENVEITSYQVTYARLDTGTRVPPPLVAAITEEVPVNGTGTISNLPILLANQLLNPPLSDLANFGFDTQTGTGIIVLNVQIQFFGNTLSGDKVQTPVASYTIQFTP
jgi:hypothetical protein